MISILTNTTGEQISKALVDGINSAIILYVFFLAISLVIFCIFVAVGTYVVKKVWFSNWGGSPWRYR